MEIIKIILKIVSLISIIYMIYYVAIAMCAFIKKKKQYTQIDYKRKFAIVIPARNEELVIGNLIKSLKSQEYPKDKFDIFVVPNNCNDNTKDIAILNGANIIDCKNIEINSKGDVLRYSFKILENKDYEAYLVFDADNVVHPKFINEMNKALCLGYDVAQGYRDSKNVSDSWISSSHSIHYLVQNYFVNRARENLNKSCFINGTGFMISKKYLKENGYDSITVTEDIELSVKCGLENQRIAFVEDAITYDEQPIDFITSWKQRKRWSVGTIQVLKNYFIKLSKAIKKRNFEAFDNMIFLIAPIIQVIGTVSMIIQVIICRINCKLTIYLFKCLLLILWYIINIILTIGLIKLNKKEVKKYIKGIVFLPLFYASWVPINIIALFEKKTKWEKIEHTRIIKLENILNLNYINKNGVENE